MGLSGSGLSQERQPSRGFTIFEINGEFTTRISHRLNLGVVVAFYL